MALFLVQHGVSLPKEEDPNRSLSPEGIKETEAVAAIAAAQNIHVSRIIHSGKKRALQTAEIFLRALEPEDGITKGAGLAPMDDVAAFATTLDNDENIMLVGHLPFMERLVSYLTAGTPDQRIIRFQNSGIICLETEDAPESWFISWALYPRFD
ncbi:MAG: phosphohistidine phosphatase SixA [Deltaproteobacteria bacterium]|jgi:phosphohistidine phosphatase|nr:phosphohistidine phosphatase SixA [Deltaproteobacteria bacterium]